jgi:hypothetical protein
MPIVANTFQTNTAVGNREELHNRVVMTDPEETPIYSSLGKITVKSINPNWETEALAAPGLNVREEGRVFTMGATVPPVRVENQTQIMDKSGAVSGTQQSVMEAGPVQKAAHQKTKKGKELRRDLEFTLVSPQITVQGVLARAFGSLTTWATTNVSRSAGGVNGGYNSGTKLTVAPTNGSAQRALSKLLIDDVLESGYKSGVNLNKLFFSTYAKRQFVTVMSDANVAPFRKEASKGKNTIIGDAEVYMGPSGTVTVFQNRQMTTAAVARNGLVLDTKYIDFGWLRRIHEAKPQLNADADSFVIQGEGTLVPRTEKAIGVIADIFGINATT